MKKKTIAWISVISIGIVMFFLWLGFLYTNPNMTAWVSWTREKVLFLWVPRIFIPVLYGVIVFLIFTKNRRLAQNIGVLNISLVIGVLVSVPVLYFSNAKESMNRTKELYHPYLQLTPPDTDILNRLFSKNSIKIFCLGGSTTEFKDNDHVGWPERLEKELRQRYNSDSIFVFNFGRQWYTTLHSLINYETNLRHHKPDVIILMHNVNDFIQNADFSYLSNGSFRGDYGHFVGPVVDILNLKNTGLFGRGWIKFRNFWYYDFPAKKVIEQDSFPGLESYTRNINTLIDLAAIDNTKVILLTQPNIYSESMDEQMQKVCVTVNYEGAGKDKMWGYHTGYTGMRQYNERMKKISESRNTYFIDLEKYIPKSLDYFLDEVHYTDKSFPIISKTLAQEIIRLEILSDLIKRK